MFVPGSIYSTLAVAIERYVSVCHPLYSPSHCSGTVAIITLILFSLLFNICRFLEFTTTYDSKVNKAANVLFQMKWLAIIVSVVTNRYNNGNGRWLNKVTDLIEDTNASGSSRSLKLNWHTFVSKVSLKKYYCQSCQVSLVIARALREGCISLKFSTCSKKYSLCVYFNIPSHFKYTKTDVAQVFLRWK